MMARAHGEFAPMPASEMFRTLFFCLGAATLLVVVLAYGRPWLVPIAVAVLIWFLINALAQTMRNRAPFMPGWAATTLSLLLLGLGALAVTQIIARNVGALTEGLTGADDRLVEVANQGLAALGLDQRVSVGQLMRGLHMETLLTEGLNAAGGIVSNISLVFLYVAFLLVDQRFYDAKMRALVPQPARRDRLRATLKHIADETRAYLWLMTLISAGVGVATGLILWAFQVPGAGFWGFLAFGLNFIPTIGSILGVAIPCVYALLALPDAGVLLALVPALMAVQLIAGEVVLPRLMGDRLNLSAFVILLLLVVWGAMWGPAGMFLAIPITVILMIVFAEFPATRPIALALSKSGKLSDIPDWTDPDESSAPDRSTPDRPAPENVAAAFVAAAPAAAPRREPSLGVPARTEGARPVPLRREPTLTAPAGPIAPVQHRFGE
jgi:AI-2 transport protein TqsA